MNKNVAIFLDKTRVNSNGSKYFSGELTALTDTSVTVSLVGCSYASEVCISLDIISFVLRVVDS